MKKKSFIIIIVALALVVVSEAVVLFIFGNKIHASAEINQGQNNNENKEINLEELLTEFNYNDSEMHYDYMESFIRFVREKGNPDFMSDWKRPEIDTKSDSQQGFELARDAAYAEDNFTGTYVKDELSALAKIPYYSADEILFGVKVNSCSLGYDTSLLEYQNAGDSRLYWLMKYFPNDEIRERSDGSRYLVYDTDDNCRLFLMLSPDSPRAIVVGYPILYKNELSYKDFSGIQSGATMTEVSAIDDICEYYRKLWFDFSKLNEYSFENGGDKWPEFATIHYLTDGLLKISYGSLNSDGDPVVKHVEFYPNYVMQTYTMKDLNYRINPLDLQK